MAKIVTLRGNAKVVKFYNLSIIDEIDFDNFDLASKEDIDNLLSVAEEIVEEGELDAVTAPLELNALNIDDAELEVDEEPDNIEKLTLKNTEVEAILEELQDAEIGDVYYIYSLEGEGTWDIEVDSEDFAINQLEVDYIDCAAYFDQFDILREGYLDLLCDTILPDTLQAKDIPTEVKDFYLDSTQEYGELYKVVESDGIKVLERIPNSGRVLAGTDCNIDDLLEN
jgi:hypothetical protein